MWSLINQSTKIKHYNNYYYYYYYYYDKYTRSTAGWRQEEQQACKN